MKILIYNAVILNQPECKFGEVLLPWSFVVGSLGFVTAWLLVTVIEQTGLSRHVWNLPLFFVGLVVLFSSLIGLIFQP